MNKALTIITTTYLGLHGGRSDAKPMGDDQMQNQWGCDLVLSPPHAASKTFQDLDRRVRSDVVGYKLHSVTVSGTEANSKALLCASEYGMSRCLFGLGTYLGGDQFLQDMSTSMYSERSRLSAPKSVYRDCVSKPCLEQTVPLPYWVDCRAFTLKERRDHETKCLRALHKKLIVAKLKGLPYRVLLIEYILGGTGGELSKHFLERLAPLLATLDIVVIADEVLTGGRVGPTMAMTNSMPSSFVDRVEFITMGKFLECGLVLQKIPKKPTHCNQELRGSSTHYDFGKACMVWSMVSERQKTGVITERRKQALRCLKIGDRDNEAKWGQGLLIFTRLTRNPVHTGLKNRCLPMMEPSLKLSRLRCISSNWTRSTLCKELKQAALEWIEKQDKHLEDSRDGFVAVLTDYLFSDKPVRDNGGVVKFRHEDLEEFMGKQRAEKLAEKIRKEKRNNGFVCNKKTTTLVSEAILRSLENTDEQLMYRKRKGNKRIQFIYLDAKLLGL